MRYLKNAILLIFVFSFVDPVCASLQSKIDGLINNKKLNKVVFGISVLDADTGKLLYESNALRPLTPASNMKLLTSLSALHYLGKDYTFDTKVYLYQNDLIIVGAGDPLLADEVNDNQYGRKRFWELDKILQELKLRKVASIQNIIVDSSFFDDNRTHPSWQHEQLNRHYAAQVSGLNYNDNCIEIQATRSGNSVLTSLLPDTKYVSLHNKATVATKKRNTVWCSRVANSNNITLYGKCYNQAPPIKVTVDRPACFFGLILAEKLIKNGIAVKGSVVEKYCKDKLTSEPILSFTTPLKDVLTRCNRDSFGLAAECLLKTISANFTQNKVNGEWLHSQKMIKNYLTSIGIDSDQIFLDDGSGLSDKNKITPNLLTQLMFNIYKTDDWQYLKDTLALGGISGSSPVRKYFKDPQYRGKIFAKSGTIDGVKALSGFIESNNRNYFFSIIANNANGYTRTAINDIVKAIVDNTEN